MIYFLLYFLVDFSIHSLVYFDILEYIFVYFSIF